MRTHACGNPVTAFELRQPGEGICHSLQGKCEREDTAAVDRGPDLVLVDLRRFGVNREHLALHSMAAEPVALAPPATSAAQRQHAGMLAGAVVLEWRRRIACGAALELGLG